MIPGKGVIIFLLLLLLLLKELLLEEAAAQAVLLLVHRDLAGGDVTGAAHKLSKPEKTPQRSALRVASALGPGVIRASRSAPHILAPSVLPSPSLQSQR